MKRWIAIILLLGNLINSQAADVILGKISDLSFPGSGTDRIGTFSTQTDQAQSYMQLWYKMDGTDTNTLGVTNSGVAGAAYDLLIGPSIAIGPTFTNFAGKNCWYFDGLNDFMVETGMVGSVIQPYGDRTTNYTVSFWMYQNNYTGINDGVCSVRFTNINNWGYFDFIITGGQARWLHEGQNVVGTYPNGLLLPTNDWLHICFTYEGDPVGIGIVYTNGVSALTTNGSVVLSSAISNQFYIGGYYSETSTRPKMYLYGYRLYNTNLTPIQVTNVWRTAQ